MRTPPKPIILNPEDSEVVKYIKTLVRLFHECYPKHTLTNVINEIKYTKKLLYDNGIVDKLAFNTWLSRFDITDIEASNLQQCHELHTKTPLYQYEYYSRGNVSEKITEYHSHIYAFAFQEYLNYLFGKQSEMLDKYDIHDSKANFSFRKINPFPGFDGTYTVPPIMMDWLNTFEEEIYDLISSDSIDDLLHRINDELDVTESELSECLKNTDNNVSGLSVLLTNKKHFLILKQKELQYRKDTIVPSVSSVKSHIPYSISGKVKQMDISYIFLEFISIVFLYHAELLKKRYKELIFDSPYDLINFPVLNGEIRELTLNPHNMAELRKLMENAATITEAFDMIEKFEEVDDVVCWRIDEKLSAVYKNDTYPPSYWLKECNYKIYRYKYSDISRFAQSVKYHVSEVLNSYSSSQNKQLAELSGSEKNSHKKNEKVKKFYEYILHKDKISIANNLKKEFDGTKGKTIKLMLLALKEKELIIIENRQLKNVFFSLEKFFRNYIGTYTSINDFKYVEQKHSKDYEAILLLVEKCISPDYGKNN